MTFFTRVNFLCTSYKIEMHTVAYASIEQKNAVYAGNSVGAARKYKG